MIFIIKGSNLKVKLQVKGLFPFFFFFFLNLFKGPIKKHNYLCLKDRYKIRVLLCLFWFRIPLCLCLTQKKKRIAIIHKHSGKEP